MNPGTRNGPMMLPTLLAIPKAPAGITFGLVDESHLARTFALEIASYPADEAATKEKLQMRMRDAGDFFRAAYSEDGIPCGFICGTLTTATKLTDESMSSHEPEGATLCIHSVVGAFTARSHRRGRSPQACMASPR